MLHYCVIRKSQNKIRITLTCVLKVCTVWTSYSLRLQQRYLGTTFYSILEIIRWIAKESFGQLRSDTVRQVHLYSKCYPKIQSTYYTQEDTSVWGSKGSPLHGVCLCTCIQIHMELNINISISRKSKRASSSCVCLLTIAALRMDCTEKGGLQEGLLAWLCSAHHLCYICIEHVAVFVFWVWTS